MGRNIIRKQLVKQRKIVIVGVMLILVAGGFFIINNKVETDDFISSEHGIRLTYNANSLTAKQLSKQDLGNKYLFRLENNGQQSDPLLVTLRYQDDLEFVANAIGKSVEEAAADSLKRQLPSVYPDYELTSEGFDGIDGVRAEVLAFNYTNNQQPLTQRTLIVPRTSDKVLVLQMQALSENFQTAHLTVFEPLVKSIELF